MILQMIRINPWVCILGFIALIAVTYLMLAPREPVIVRTDRPIIVVPEAAINPIRAEVSRNPLKGISSVRMNALDSAFGSNKATSQDRETEGLVRNIFSNSNMDVAVSLVQCTGDTCKLSGNIKPPTSNDGPVAKTPYIETSLYDANLSNIKYKRSSTDYLVIGGGEVNFVQYIKKS